MELLTDKNHYQGVNCWVVQWSDGTTQRYVPYDSIGMSRFIRNGLDKGKVTVNTFEVEGFLLDEQNDKTWNWRYKK